MYSQDPPPFRNRQDAGRQLARQIQSTLFDSKKLEPASCIVVALPRGGVPVANEVAQALKLPLELLIVRKLGVPGNPEYALGALASGNVKVLNPEVISYRRISPEQIDQVVHKETRELARREALYLGGKENAAEEVSREQRKEEKGRTAEARVPQVRGKTAILIDDGIATGSTVKAAVAALQQLQAQRVIVAAPVAAPDSLEMLRAVADEVLCLFSPKSFYAVGPFYEDFSQTSDEEVCAIIDAKKGDARKGDARKDGAE